MSAAWEGEGERSSFILIISLKKSSSLHYHEFLFQSASHFQDAIFCFLLTVDFFHNLYSRIGCFTSLNKATLVPVLVPCVCHYNHTGCPVCGDNTINLVTDSS